MRWKGGASRQRRSLRRGRRRLGFLSIHSSGFRSGSPAEVISVVFYCAQQQVLGAERWCIQWSALSAKEYLNCTQEKTHNTNVEGLCLNIEWESVPLHLPANTIFIYP